MSQRLLEMTQNCWLILSLWFYTMVQCRLNSGPPVCRLWTCHLQQPAQLPEGCVCRVCGDQNPQVYKEGEDTPTVDSISAEMIKIFNFNKTEYKSSYPPPRSRLTLTWKTPCVKFAFANLGLSSAETRWAETSALQRDAGLMVGVSPPLLSCCVQGPSCQHDISPHYYRSEQ